MSNEKQKITKLIKNSNTPYIVDPFDFCNIENKMNEIIEHMSNTDNEDIDEIKESIVSILSVIDVYLKTEVIDIETDYLLELPNKEIVITANCENNPVDIDLKNIQIGQKVIVSKQDDSVNKLNIKTTNDIIFWNGENSVSLTSKNDTVTFFKLKDKLIIGV